jgi:hypothetical protein
MSIVVKKMSEATWNSRKVPGVPFCDMLSQ